MAPDSGLRKDTRPGWDKGLYAFIRQVVAGEHGKAIYRRRQTTAKLFEQRAARATVGQLVDVFGAYRRMPKRAATVFPVFPFAVGVASSR
jgi:hypothetical protein